MRTMQITGCGRLKVHTDVTLVTLTLETVDPDHDEALRRSTRDTEELRARLAGSGFARTDLKTVGFQVSTKYEDFMDGDEYRQRFAGYQVWHQMKLEFPSDDQRLSGVLAVLSASPAAPEIRLSYTVGDPESVKNRLLEIAVADAREKAAVLARAAGVELKEIRQIGHAWDEFRLRVDPAEPMILSVTPGADRAARSLSLDIEPEDLDIQDTVTVVWEIG